MNNWCSFVFEILIIPSILTPGEVQSPHSEVAMHTGSPFGIESFYPIQSHSSHQFDRNEAMTLECVRFELGTQSIPPPTKSVTASVQSWKVYTCLASFDFILPRILLFLFLPRMVHMGAGPLWLGQKWQRLLPKTPEIKSEKFYVLFKMVKYRFEDSLFCLFKQQEVSFSSLSARSEKNSVWVQRTDAELP